MENEKKYEDLTEKQKRFIDYYIETGNASEACRRAGYKGKNLNTVGAENLAKLGNFIKEKMSQKQSERIASQDEVLEYLTRVMRGQEKDAFGLDPSLQDRTKCAELLGKRYALFTDKKEFSGEGAISVTIVDDVHE